MGGKELSKPELISDGLHPNVEGFQVIAETIFKAL